MLSILRKHQYGIMFIVAIIVIIAFAFLYDPNRDSYRTSDDIIRVYDKNVRTNQFNRIAKSRELLGGLGLYQYLFGIMGQDRRFARTDGSDMPHDFVFNTLIVREEAARLGIDASATEIEAAIRELGPLQTNQQFDPEKWENLKNNVAAFGFNQQVIFQVVEDSVLYDRLRALVTSGILPSPREIEERYHETNAKIFAEVIRIPRTKFEDAVEITDEEIATYYENNRDNLLSEEQRGLTYVFFKEPVKGENDAPAESLSTDLDVSLTDDGTESGDADADADARESDAAFAERESRFQERVAEFDQAIVEENGVARFRELAADPRFVELTGGAVTVPPFAFGDEPEALREKPDLVAALFDTPAGIDVGRPVAADGGYYFFLVDAIVEPAPLPLEEARDRIVETLRREKIDERLATHAAETREAITAALAEEGTTFAEAASAAGYETVDIPMFTSGQPPRDIPDGAAISAAVAAVNPGEVAAPADTAEGVVLAYLAARELPLDADPEAGKAVVRSTISRMDDDSIFANWFRSRKEAANPIILAEQGEE